MSWETTLNKNKAVKPGGERFDALIPKPSGKWVKISEQMNPIYTIQEMYEIVRETAYQTEKLTAAVVDRSKPQSVLSMTKAVWQFIYDNVLYKEENDELLREPSHSWHIQRHIGCDCDDMAIFAGTMLYNLGIYFEFRITEYQDKLTGLTKGWQHVYVIVPVDYQNNGRRYIVIDPVLNKYDFEIPFYNKKDFPNKLITMPTFRLSGFGSPTTQTTEAQELRNFLETIRAKNLTDSTFSQRFGYNQTDLEGMISRALSATNDADFFAQVEALAATEQAVNAKNGLSGLGYMDAEDDDWEDLNLGNVTQKIKAAVVKTAAKVVPKVVNVKPKTAAPKPTPKTTKPAPQKPAAPAKPVSAKTALPKPDPKTQKKTLFSTVKSVATQVKAQVQKGVQQVKAKAQTVKQQIEQKAGGKPLAQVLLNAVTKLPNAAGRAGFHLFLKLNLMGVAEILRWGYLTQAEAQAQGVPMNRYPKAVEAVNKIKKFHYQMGGTDKTLQKVIKNHIGKRINGQQKMSGYEYEQILGAAGVDDAALLASALPTIAGVVKIMNDTGVIKMLMDDMKAPAAMPKPTPKKVVLPPTKQSQPVKVKVAAKTPLKPAPKPVIKSGKVKGFGDVDAEGGVNEFYDAAGEYSADVNTADAITNMTPAAKDNLLKKLWGIIKGIFGKKVNVDLATGEVLNLEQYESVTVSDEEFAAIASGTTELPDESEDASGNRSADTGGDTVLYWGIGIGLVAVYALTQSGEKKNAGADLGGYKNDDQIEHFKKVKQRKGFSLSQ